MNTVKLKQLRQELLSAAGGDAVLARKIWEEELNLWCRENSKSGRSAEDRTQAVYERSIARAKSDRQHQAPNTQRLTPSAQQMKIVLLDAGGAPILRTDVPDFPVQPEIVFWGVRMFVRISPEGTYKEACYLYLNPKPPYV